MADDRLVELYRAYGGAIYARCRRILLDDHAAEDATQETFIRVQRHLLVVPSEREALRWIYRIATNHCLNILRTRKVQPIPVACLPERLTGDDDAWLADRDALRYLATQVPEKLRTVAWLYHVDGCDQEEVADLLGISRRTVVTRLREFQRRAHKLLGPSR